MASLAWAAVAAAVGAFALLPSLVEGRSPGQVAWSFVALSWVAALVLLVRAWHAAYRLGFGYERLRGALLNLLVDRDGPLPVLDRRVTPLEIRALHDAVAQYQGLVAQERHGPDGRLTAVLASLSSGVVVVTGQGQVSLVNSAARELLGAERVRVGTSVFASLERHALLDSVERARTGEGPVEARFRRIDGAELHGRVTALPNGDGAILLFPPVELDRHRPGVDFDLGLHDLPPEAGPPTPGLLLDDVPTVVLDTETTGLDVAQDRIVSIGAIRGHGTRLYPGSIVDSLVNPGVPIPRASTAVHGITDVMVADARPFPAVWEDFRRLARHGVVVGHNVPFDLAILRAEAIRHGCAVEEFPFLDTFRLAVMLDPGLRSHELESLASFYGVDVHGRHTALGDALVTAEVFVRMLPRLRQLGLETLGHLLRAHDRDVPDLVRRQRDAGWIWEQPAQFRILRGR